MIVDEIAGCNRPAPPCGCDNDGRQINPAMSGGGTTGRAEAGPYFTGDKSQAIVHYMHILDYSLLWILRCLSISRTKFVGTRLNVAYRTT